MQESFSGLFPRDNPKNTRFSINFFTSIGLGGLTVRRRSSVSRDMTRRSKRVRVACVLSFVVCIARTRQTCPRMIDDMAVGGPMAGRSAHTFEASPQADYAAAEGACERRRQ